MSKPRVEKFGKCDFCPKVAVVQFSRQSKYSKLGRPRVMTLHYRACADHEGCPAWQSIIDLYSDAAAKAQRPIVQAVDSTASGGLK
jgi:hypothetical protein